MKRTILDVVQSTTLMWQNLCGTRYYEVKEKEAALHEEIEKSGAPGVPSRRGVQVSHTSYSSNFPLRPTEVQRETSGEVVRSHSRVELESATFHVGSYVWRGGVQAPWCAGCLPLRFCMDFEMGRMQWSGAMCSRKAGKPMTLWFDLTALLGGVKSRLFFQSWMLTCQNHPTST